MRSCNSQPGVRIPPGVREQSQGVRQKFKAVSKNAIKWHLTSYILHVFSFSCLGAREQKKVGNLCYTEQIWSKCVSLTYFCGSTYFVIWKSNNGQFHQHNLRAAFTSVAPQSVRIQSSRQYRFTIFGPTRAKALHKMLMKSTLHMVY